MPKKWTPLEDKALARLFTEGKSDKQIFDLKILPGRSENAIHIRRSDIGAVAYTKEPFTHQNKSINRKKPGKAVLQAGAQLEIAHKFRKVATTVTEPAIIDEASAKCLPVTFMKKELPPLPDGATGSFVIFCYSDRIDFQARGLAPRQVVGALAKVIQNIV